MSKSAHGENATEALVGQQAGVDSEASIRQHMVNVLSAATAEQIQEWEQQRLQLLAEAQQKLQLAKEIGGVQDRARTEIGGIEQAKGVEGVIDRIPLLTVLEQQTDPGKIGKLWEAGKDAARAALSSNDPQVLAWALERSAPSYQGNELAYCNALQNPDRQVKMAALKALEGQLKLGNKEGGVFSLLRTLLDGDDPEIAVLAIKAHNFATHDWIEAVMSKQDVRLHDALADYLVTVFLNNTEDRKSVGRLLTSPSAKLRMAALNSSRFFLNPPLEAYIMVIALLDDPDSGVRKSAYNLIFNSAMDINGNDYFYLDTRTEEDVERGVLKRDLARQRKSEMLGKLKQLMETEKDPTFKARLEDRVRDLARDIESQ